MCPKGRAGDYFLNYPRDSCQDYCLILIADFPQRADLTRFGLPDRGCTGPAFLHTRCRRRWCTSVSIVKLTSRPPEPERESTPGRN